MKRRVTVDEWLRRLSEGEFRSSGNARKSVAKQQTWSKEDKARAVKAIEQMNVKPAVPVKGRVMGLRDLLNVSRDVVQMGNEVLSLLEKAKNMPSPDVQQVVDGVLGCVAALNVRLTEAHGATAPKHSKKMRTETKPVLVPSHGGNGQAGAAKSLSFDDLAPPRSASS